MGFNFKNLDKPSNKTWKRIADYLLFTCLPAINVFFVAVQPVSPTFSLWAIAITTLLISLFKGLTKFTAEPEPVVEPIVVVEEATN